MSSIATAPVVSVVVPTRDRPTALARCLDALAAQSLIDGMEVLVVDDASAAPDAIESVVRRYPRARLIRAEGRGPASARNAGAFASRGAYLCFTDDDCEPAENWVEELVEVLRGGADAAAGTTIPAGGALAETLDVVARAPIAREVDRDIDDLSFAPSNNIACSREAFDAIPFDESYPHAAGEDREWCARLLAAGYTLRRAREARVLHRPELTVGRFLRQQIRYGDGAFRFRRLSEAGSPLDPPGYYLDLLRGSFRQGLVVGLLFSVAQVATAFGFGRAWLRQRRRGS